MTELRLSDAPLHGVEWIGARIRLSRCVDASGQIVPVECAFWIVAPEGPIVGQAVVGPDESEGVLGRVLLAALQQPLAGPPHRPARLRVAERAAAGEVQDLGTGIPVVVAATPETDAIGQELVASMDSAAPSYLDGGRLSADAMAEVFEAAHLLYGLAPWERAGDSDVVRMDIPALGVEGAVVVVIGALGESLGLLVFPSLEVHEAFLGAAKDRDRDHPADFGDSWLAFQFEPGDEIPDAMQREVSGHGWPLAGDDVYPLVVRRDRQGASVPLEARDLAIAAACMTSFSAFFVTHREVFETGMGEPISESFRGDDDTEVRFTMPYEALDLFEPAPRSPFEDVGRNDPCPCGSGRKYKRCHLREVEADRVAAAIAARTHDLDCRLTLHLVRYAQMRFGNTSSVVHAAFADAEEASELAIPWSVYGCRYGGRTLLDWFEEEPDRDLEDDESAWLRAQDAAWLTVWQVVGVEPGRAIALVDPLSGEERRVQDVTATRSLMVGSALLGRVVDHAGLALLCGVHPQPLWQAEADEVVRRARGRLRLKRAVPIDRLRDEDFGRYLIRRWEEAVDGFD